MNKCSVHLDFDPIEDETSFPCENLEVMQESLRRKSERKANSNISDGRKSSMFLASKDAKMDQVNRAHAKVNGLNLTSLGYGRGSIVVQRNSIGRSSATLIPTDPIEVDTSFPLDNFELMQENLRRKQAKGLARSFTSLESVRRIALSELAQDNNFVASGVDPMQDNCTLPRDKVEVIQGNQRSKTGLCESNKVKKVRGPNLCKVVTGLKPGEKLKVTFFHNRLVGHYHSLFSRHLGSLVRDRNMCPLRVHSWADIEEAKLDHMWGAVTDKFDSDNMNDQRDHVLRHMRRLWSNWRGSLHKTAKSMPLQEVLKYEPEGVDKSDWEWLVKEHFLIEKFKETSTRNIINRSKLRMPHRTGSKTIREIIYELGGKHGNPPDMATIFFETRKKGNKICELETQEKYVEIQELLEVEPSLTNIEIVERCFGPQRKSHVVGFGGGITSKEFK